MKAAVGGLVGAMFLVSCASSGTEPHAMTAAKHEETARNEEAASQEHQKQYDPSQTVAPQGGSFGQYVGCPGSPAAMCFPGWSSVRNPTESHLADARRHAELAARHRAASQELRGVEARTCNNISAGDRDMSPFYHREDIVSVEPSTERTGRYGRRVVGAEVVFAALPGMTSEWLQRVVDCHLARNAVLGDDDKTMSYCPLAVPHTTAVVHSVGNGFAVDIRAIDDRSVKDVVSRAEALTGNPAPGPN